MVAERPHSCGAVPAAAFSEFGDEHRGSSAGGLMSRDVGSLNIARGASGVVSAVDRLSDAVWRALRRLGYKRCWRENREGKS